MIPPEAREALREALGDAVRFEVPLSRYTSLRVGGPADALATPEDRPALARLIRVSRRFGLPRVVLGNGFNTVVRDGGLDGVVVRLDRFRKLEQEAPDRLRVEAGVRHSTLTRFCVERGLAGLEFGAGIPGTLGGWIAMNAGIPDREIGHAVAAVEVFGPDGEARLRRREELDFRYRALHGLEPGSVVVSARLLLTPSTSEAVQAEVDRHLAHRSGTQPLHQPSCGSVFKNPPGDHAGRLIEATGLKGERIGGAAISDLHANFIVNLGGARAADVIALVERARARVHESSGVWLEPEVRILGREEA